MPADLVAALRVVPEMARDVARMNRNTEVLGEVAQATAALPRLHEDMARVAKATEAIGALDARMANIEAAMPVLVEVQQHLARLPETMESLDGRISELSTVLDRNARHDGHAVGQRRAPRPRGQPLGRIARRMPGRSKPDDSVA